jgi:hypothetical protein
MVLRSLQMRIRRRRRARLRDRRGPIPRSYAFVVQHRSLEPDDPGPKNHSAPDLDRESDAYSFLSVVRTVTSRRLSWEAPGDGSTWVDDSSAVAKRTDAERQAEGN